MVVVALKLELDPAVKRFYEKTKSRLEGQVLIRTPEIYLYKNRYLIYHGKPMIPFSPLWLGLALDGILWMFKGWSWLLWIGVAIMCLEYFISVTFTKKRLMKGLKKEGYDLGSIPLDYEEVLGVLLNGTG